MSVAAAARVRPLSTASHRVWLLAAALGFAFFVAEHNWRTSLLEDFAEDVEQMQAGASGGSLTRQLGFSLVAAIGVGCILRRPRFSMDLADPVARLAIFCFCWCLASVAWSDDPAFTAKRVTIVAFCLVGVLGICRQLDLRQVAWLTLAVTCGFALAGILVEVALGTFRPWSGDYRFGGTMHPNAQGFNCAILCLASASLAIRNGRWNRQALAMLVVGGALLLLTRSRTCFLAVSLALVTLGLAAPGGGKAKLAAIVALAFVLCAGAWLLAAMGHDPGQSLFGAAMLGREGDAEAFNGRLPVWVELVSNHVAKHPWIGYGYNTFWNAQNIEDISAIFYWGIRESHSAYVEALLGIGLIGAAGLLALVAAALTRAFRGYRATSGGDYAFILGILIFGLVVSVMESAFVLANWASFLACSAVATLAFRPVSDGLSEQPGGPQS
jgi:exopolysaccharide production protein ExoQ